MFLGYFVNFPYMIDLRLGYSDFRWQRHESTRKDYCRTQHRSHTRAPPTVRRSYTIVTVCFYHAKHSKITTAYVDAVEFLSKKHCQHENPSFRTNIKSTAHSPSIVKTIIDLKREYRSAIYRNVFENSRHILTSRINSWQRYRLRIVI